MQVWPIIAICAGIVAAAAAVVSKEVQKIRRRKRYEEVLNRMLAEVLLP
jgi:hypothetical protein